MRSLDLKLFRDLAEMKGQMLSVTLVMVCGLSVMIMSRGLVVSLEETERSYYASARFADIFCELKRAPNWLGSRIAEIDGVAEVETRIRGTAILDIPGMKEPADGVVLSLPENSPRRLNLLHVKAGRIPEPGRVDEIAVSAGFAQAHGFLPGDDLDMTVYGVRRRFRISGIVLSPEFIYETRAGEMLPEPRRFGIFWMNYGGLSRALGLDGAFNSVSLRLSPDADIQEVKADLDRMLAPYGGLTAYGRDEHPSAKMMQDELRGLRGTSVAFPVVFLAIAAFMAGTVLTRLVKLQRQQIAQLRAFGYTSSSVAFHYLKFVLVPVAGATALSGTLGMWAGRGFVSLYQQFFQFPALVFTPDWGALAIGLTGGAAFMVLGVLRAVSRAASIPPAEGMRPEAPARYAPSPLERAGIHRLFSPSLRMALRNLERKPWQALLTTLGIALATAIPVFPGAMTDGVEYLMEFQWNLSQRQDASLGLLEPAGPGALSSILRLPGVYAAEPFRSVPVILRSGHIQWRTAINGLPEKPLLNRLLDENAREIILPPSGLVMSRKLAEILKVSPGDPLQVEVREGRRPVLQARLSRTITDFAGLAVYMEIDALRRFLGEEGTISGAHVKVDMAEWEAFLEDVKESPRVASLGLTGAVRENFSRTIAEMMWLSQAMFFSFSIIVAFGVVYNGARIALSERSRDLATLRVLGFTKREVSATLLLAMAMVTAAAIVPGHLLGRCMMYGLMQYSETEVYRFSVVVTAGTYWIAAGTVLLSSGVSFAAAARKVSSLDLLAVLKSGE